MHFSSLPKNRNKDPNLLMPKISHLYQPIIHVSNGIELPPKIILYLHDSMPKSNYLLLYNYKPMPPHEHLQLFNRPIKISCNLKFPLLISLYYRLKLPSNNRL
jgi:hypothetical protein